MGNDILKPRKKSTYIPTKLLAPSKSSPKIDQSTIEKVFGKRDASPLRKNHTVSYFVPSSSIQEPIQEENTFEEEESIDSPPLRETQAQNSIHSRQNAESLDLLQEEIRKMRRILYDQTFMSRNQSPVGREQQKREKINGSSTRNCRHYFKLKGCDKENRKQQQPIQRR